MSGHVGVSEGLELCFVTLGQAQIQLHNLNPYTHNLNLNLSQSVQRNADKCVCMRQSSGKSYVVSSKLTLDFSSAPDSDRSSGRRYITVALILINIINIMNIILTLLTLIRLILFFHNCDNRPQFSIHSYHESDLTLKH